MLLYTSFQNSLPIFIPTCAQAGLNSKKLCYFLFSQETSNSTKCKYKCVQSYTHLYIMQSRSMEGG